MNHIADKQSLQQSAPAQVLHVSICICTYRRPDSLSCLLDSLRNQTTEGRITYSIVVVDNDEKRSAERIVTQFAATSDIRTTYCVEPRQNIARARNKAIANANGDYILFVDDDEFTADRWILTLVDACEKYEADGALGPVKPYFAAETPQWVRDGKFYDRPSYPTGLMIDGSKGRTGNTLLKRSIFRDVNEPFRPEFRTGEDQDFFRRMIEKGHKFVWCHEAIAWEVVPPIRWGRRFILRRALLRGAVARLHPRCDTVDIMKSFVALLIYAVIAPLSLMRGQSTFMMCIVRLCDHLGKVLAVIGIHPVKDPYVTE